MFIKGSLMQIWKSPYMFVFIWNQYPENFAFLILNNLELFACEVCKTDYNTSNFYGLPKIHRSQLITNAIKEQNSEVVSINETQDLKIRPIVGGPKCPTRKLSELIDALLKPFLKHVKSYIRDSIDFLNKCDRNTDRNTVIATFDVVGLYTNIPHTFGMEAVRYFLLKYKEDIHPRFNIPFILESIDFILKNNTCVFDNEYFLQLQGTAMGTVFASTLAWGTMKSNFMI